MRVRVDANRVTGVCRWKWGGRDNLGRMVANGIYLYRLQAGQNVAVRKMAFLKQTANTHRSEKRKAPEQQSSGAFPHVAVCQRLREGFRVRQLAVRQNGFAIRK